MEYTINRLAYFMILCLFISCCSCSDSCEGEDPTLKLVNSGTGRADIQIKTSGGNTENINNVETGTSSDIRSIAPGLIEFTIAIQGVNDPIEYSLIVYYCTNYTVTINSDNSVTAASRPMD